MQTSVRHLVFDLGGVLLNLSPQRTMESFASLASLTPQRVAELYHQREEFLQYEKGAMSDTDFRDSVRTIFSVDSTDQELDACWNAMLLDLPLERLRLLETLRSKHRIFLLSNTNAIHVRHFEKTVQAVAGHRSLDPFFDKVYFSHVIKMRKPDHEIYQYVLADNGLRAEDTLFLDDNEANIRGASEVGMQTFHVQHPDQLFALFA